MSVFGLFPFQSSIYQEDTLMLLAQLYFLSNEYYQDFPDDKLTQNKDTIDGVPHSRPCFFAFPDSKYVSGN